jgi:hypothetical protein
MVETKPYTGSCHCGQVRYEVSLVLEKALDCNCSHCSRKGFLWSFVPAAQFKLLSGEGALTEYRFNKKVLRHVFCATCGVQSFASGESGGKPLVAINVRCLEGVDLSSLTIQKVDGKRL